MLWKRRVSSVGRYASCKKLAINRLTGNRFEKDISGHSLLGLTILSLRCLLRNTGTVRATLPLQLLVRLRAILA